jgi:hypothetical protein
LFYNLVDLIRLFFTFLTDECRKGAVMSTVPTVPPNVVAKTMPSAKNMAISAGEWVLTSLWLAGGILGISVFLILGIFLFKETSWGTFTLLASLSSVFILLHYDKLREYWLAVSASVSIICAFGIALSWWTLFFVALAALCLLIHFGKVKELGVWLAGEAKKAFAFLWEQGWMVIDYILKLLIKGLMTYVGIGTVAILIANKVTAQVAIPMPYFGPCTIEVKYLVMLCGAFLIYLGIKQFAKSVLGAIIPKTPAEKDALKDKERKKEEKDALAEQQKYERELKSLELTLGADVAKAKIAELQEKRRLLDELKAALTGGQIDEKTYREALRKVLGIQQEQKKKPD